MKNATQQKAIARIQDEKTRIQLLEDVIAYNLSLSEIKRKIQEIRVYCSIKFVISNRDSIHKRANELFSSMQDLSDRIQQLFEQLTFDRVISISSYNFILEALFYAASY